MNGLLFFGGHMQVLMMDGYSTNYRVLHGKGVYGARGVTGTYPPSPDCDRLETTLARQFLPVLTTLLRI